MARRMIDALPDGSPGGRGEKLLISRAKAARRHLVNEAEVQALLEGNGFTTIHFEDHALDEQIRIMAGARVVVSQHGAGLANTIFMKPGGTVVEITGRHIDDITYFQLARALGHDYLYINGDVGDAPALNQHADMIVPVDALNTVLQQI
jgi:capsular polysaccharide biosynthesis protein